MGQIADALARAETRRLGDGSADRAPVCDLTRRWSNWFIIKLLYERYQQGDRWVSSDEIVVELDLRDGARIRDFFKKNRSWGLLLTERNGMCGFCLDGPAVTSPGDTGDPRRRSRRKAV